MPCLLQFKDWIRNLIYRKFNRVASAVKWNESGFRPPLSTFRLNWARRTSWGWLDDWDDTVLQTQDSKFKPWRSEAEHTTSRSRRLPTIQTFTRRWGRNNFCFFQTAETGNRTPNTGVKGSGANHYPRTLALHQLWPLYFNCPLTIILTFNLLYMIVFITHCWILKHRQSKMILNI